MWSLYYEQSFFDNCALKTYYFNFLKKQPIAIDKQKRRIKWSRFFDFSMSQLTIFQRKCFCARAEAEESPFLFYDHIQETIATI